MVLSVRPMLLAGPRLNPGAWVCWREWQPRRGLKKIPLVPPTPYENVNIPERNKLPIVPKTPQVWMASALGSPPKFGKDLWSMHGEEYVHNKLLLGQYGIIALSGGMMEQRHFEHLRNRTQGHLEPNKSFAIFRVDAPHKPLTKKHMKRGGGGKGKVKSFYTPVKAGRVILEVGGRVDWDEVRPWLSRYAETMPFEAIAVNQKNLDRLNAEEKHLEEINENPYTLEWLIRNNIFNCQDMLTPKDRKWFGKFTYRDRTNNIKWQEVLNYRYKSK